MKRNVLLLLTLLSLQAWARSPEIKARAAFMDAQEQYGNGNFSEAIKQLNAVKELLGSTNPRVEYLLAQSYMGADQPDKAELSLKKYFELSDEADPNYNAMLVMIKQIAQQKEEVKNKLEAEARENSTWEETNRINSLEAYEAYRTSFPNGKYRAQALAKIKTLPPPPLVDSRDGKEYKTKRIGDLVWMMENLNYESPNAICDDLSTDCNQYGRFYPGYEVSTLCPSGWRLPSSDEFQEATSQFVNLFFKQVGSGPIYIAKDKEKIANLLNEETMSLDLGGTYNTMSKKVFGLGKQGRLLLSNGSFMINDKRIWIGTTGMGMVLGLNCRCVKDE